jgi:hypothetical protein
MTFPIPLPENVNFTQWGISAISPDGRKVVFAAYGYDGNPSLWLRSLDSPLAKPIEEARINQLTTALFWSPDSRSWRMAIRNN